MSREPLPPGTILRFPDGQEHQIVTLLGAGGSALMYETRILGSELYAAVKEVFPALGCVRIDGQILPLARSPRRAKELARRKTALADHETRLSQKASRRNHQVLFLQPPVWHQADIRLPDGTVFSHVENTYARMDSLAEKGISLLQYIQEHRAGSKGRLEQALRIMDTVLDAYSSLHEDGFLHGDCQISNLFLLQSGRGSQGVGTACILDFGSARELGPDGRTSPITDEIFSTDGYCAPELMFPLESELQLTAAADVWSLGFLFLTLLTDRNFNDLDGITEFLMLHPEEKRLTQTELTELGCSPAQAHLLNTILDRALSNRPEDRRYPSAGAFQKDVQTLICCHTMDLSLGIHRHLLWEASWRYVQANPNRFRTKHCPSLVKDMPVRYIFPKGRLAESDIKLSLHMMLEEAEQDRETVYVYGAGGSGKSLLGASRIQYYLDHGQDRIPLFIDLSEWTAPRFQACGQDPDRLISLLLSEQYFGHGEAAAQLSALLHTEPCYLVLDNLNQMDAAMLGHAIAWINQLAQRYPNMVALVLGRSENPSVRAEQTKVRQNHILPPPPRPPEQLYSKGPRKTRMDRKWDALFEECEALFQAYEADAALPNEPYHALTITRIELLPLTNDAILYYLKQIWPGLLSPEERTYLDEQYSVLRHPSFFLLYLEVLMLNRETETKLPNSVDAILHSYFTQQEYQANSREVHELLKEQLPWIASQYDLSGYNAHTPEQITDWLTSHFKWGIDPDTFFRHAVDTLAVLEPDRRGNYRFTQDCYRDYFTLQFAANSIRQTISTCSGYPLSIVNYDWDETLIRRSLDLCCMEERNGTVVRVRNELEVLDALSQALIKLRRRELRSLNDVLVSFLNYLNRSVISHQVPLDQTIHLRWNKLVLRSNSIFTSILTLLLVPFQSGILRRDPTVSQLRALGLTTNDGKAEYDLACCYWHGNHTRKNPKKADEYLSASAAKGYPPAYCSAGELAEEAEKLDAAVEFYRKAAQLHHPRAFWRLGRLYLHGRGVRKDPREAFRMFEQGAELGDAFAQYDLAQMLEVGFDGDENRSKAPFWYEKAALQGVKPAKSALSRIRSDVGKSSQTADR